MESKYLKSKIRRPDRMKQLIDFKGLDIGPGMYPTDIDALLEYRNKGYIFFEVKHKNAPVPFGQKLALERMVNDATKLSKKAIAIVCEHEVDDPSISIVAADCTVREVYTGDNRGWHKLDKTMNVRKLVDEFMNNSFYHCNQAKSA